MIRAVHLPPCFYEKLSSTYLQKLVESFNKLFEKTFGVQNAFYLLHVLLHLVMSREHGELTDVLALNWETSYRELRRNYYPGSRSSTKQGLQIFFTSREADKENCKILAIDETNLIVQIIKRSSIIIWSRF